MISILDFAEVDQGTPGGSLLGNTVKHTVSIYSSVNNLASMKKHGYAVVIIILFYTLYDVVI